MCSCTPEFVGHFILTKTEFFQNFLGCGVQNVESSDHPFKLLIIVDFEIVFLQDGPQKKYSSPDQFIAITFVPLGLSDCIGYLWRASFLAITHDYIPDVLSWLLMPDTHSSKWVLFSPSLIPRIHSLLSFFQGFDITSSKKFHDVVLAPQVLMEAVWIVNSHGLEGQPSSLDSDEEPLAIVDGNRGLAKSLSIIILSRLEGKGVRLYLFHPLGFLELLLLLLRWLVSFFSLLILQSLRR